MRSTPIPTQDYGPRGSQVEKVERAGEGEKMGSQGMWKTPEHTGLGPGPSSVVQ